MKINDSEDKINEKILDPFFSSLIEDSGLVKQELDNYCYDYKEILKSLDISLIGEINSDIVVCVPIKGRQEHIIPCCNYFLKSSKQCSKNISFLLIENDTEPYSKHIIEKINSDRIGYLHLPNTLCKDSTNLNRSLCYNIGFLLKKPKDWYISSDIDIIFPQTFFSNVYESDRMSGKNIGFMRPYRFVLMLDDDTTKTIISNSDKDTFNLKDFISKNAVYDNVFNTIMEKNDIQMSSSVGGCSCIAPKKYLEIGGYDPELIWGYGPEDQLIWLKMITQTFKTGFINSYGILLLHEENDIVYMKDSVYHMHHPPSASNQPHKKRYLVELNYLKIREMTYKERMKYIKKCSSNLKKGISNGN